MNVNKININQSEPSYYIASDIYDVSYHNSGTSFTSLSELLSSENLSVLIPSAIRCGGMTIRFIQTSNNKYVQYRLMTTSFSTDESDWQGVDDEPTAGSDNFVKSGGVFSSISEEVDELDGRLNPITGFNLGNAKYFSQGGINTDGTLSNSKDRISTPKTYIASHPITITTNEEYQVAIKTYTEDGVQTSDSSWRDTYIINANTYFRCIVRKVDNSNIIPEEAININAEFTGHLYTIDTKNEEQDQKLSELEYKTEDILSSLNEITSDGNIYLKNLSKRNGYFSADSNDIWDNSDNRVCFTTYIKGGYRYSIKDNVNNYTIEVVYYNDNKEWQKTDYFATRTSVNATSYPYIRIALDGVNAQTFNDNISLYSESAAGPIYNLNNSKVDKEEGKELMSSALSNKFESNEVVGYAEATKDSMGNVIEGIADDGSHVFNNNVVLNGSKTVIGVSEEHTESNNFGDNKIERTTDSYGNVIESMDFDGNFYHETNHYFKNVYVDSLSVKDIDLSEKAARDIKSIIKKDDNILEDIDGWNDYLYIEADNRIRRVYNPYKEQHLNKYMGQMHMHSYGSTGVETDEANLANYNELIRLGFDFATFTNYQNPTKNPNPNGNIIWLFKSHEQDFVSKISISDVNYHTSPNNNQHIVMWNSSGAIIENDKNDDGIGGLRYMPLQDILDKANEYGYITELAHPMWSKILQVKEKLDKIQRNLRYVEVFNGTCAVLNEAEKELYGWTQGAYENNEAYALDVLLSNGLRVFGTAVSDSHSEIRGEGAGDAPTYMYTGNIKVFSPVRTRDSILHNFMTGNFIATNFKDASIDKVYLEDGCMCVDVGERNFAHNPVIKFIGKDGEVLAEVSNQRIAKYKFTGQEMYVRAEVTTDETYTIDGQLSDHHVRKTFNYKVYTQAIMLF